MHEGHRERMRQRYLAQGLDAFQDHEVLELLLFYGIPRSNTNEIAHRLMAKFGSLAAVMEAPEKELLEVPGVGQHCVLLLKMLPDFYRRYARDKHNILNKICSSEEVMEYLRGHYAGVTQEAVTLICLDNTNSVKQIGTVGQGGLNSAVIDRRKLLSLLLSCHATAAILSHNHPHGLAKPSSSDVSATREMMELFAGIGVKLVDHVIVAGEDTYSMAQDRQYRLLFR